MMKLLGTWSDYKEPQWKTYLDTASEKVIRETGLSRKQLEKVLDILYEHRIIN